MGQIGTHGEEAFETKETPKCHSRANEVRSEKRSKKQKTKTRLQDTKGYRRKQDMIENTLKEVHDMFSGLVLPDDQALRGDDTVRLHVKTEPAIKSIVECMTEVKALPGIEITAISTPVSMKNRYQKKGFLMYFRISNTELIDSVLVHIKSNYPCFERCKVALARHKVPALTMPTRMTPQLSCEGC